MNLEKKVAIIILNYNNYNFTKNIVKNLKNNRFEGYIVVVDNCSMNNSFEILSKELKKEKEKVYVIRSEKNGGYAYGNNVGIQYILEIDNSIEYIGIVNPDVIIDENLSIEGMIKKIKYRTDIAGIAPIQLLNGEYDSKFLGWNIHSFTKLMIYNSSILVNLYEKFKVDKVFIDSKDMGLILTEVLPGSFFIMKRDIFEKIGFFDEKTFLYFEENIIGSKLKQLGYKLSVSIENYYIHDHNVKDNTFKSLNKKKSDYKYFMESQKYYIYNYTNANIIQKIIFEIFSKYRIFIEIPILHYVKRIYNVVSIRRV